MLNLNIYKGLTTRQLHGKLVYWRHNNIDELMDFVFMFILLCEKISSLEDRLDKLDENNEEWKTTEKL